jgi:succinyl-CoA synthetase beta subunit/citryl-CoA synthetase large subunit
VKVLEYEAKQLLRQAGLPVPEGLIARTPPEAAEAARALGRPFVIKAQVPIGGRMKAGGVHFGASPAEAEALAAQLLGATLRGFPVEAVLIEEKIVIADEFFAAATYDAALRRPALLVTHEGGIEVESAGQMITQPFSTLRPFDPALSQAIAAQVGLNGPTAAAFSDLLAQLAAAFLRLDALLLECNPLALDDQGRWWVADVHLELDDDAAFRQADTLAHVPHSAALANRRSAFEQQAAAIDALDHRGVAGRLIAFDGNVGMLIGGGGASLTAMDAALDCGLRPANYCEIGGNPSVRKICELTKLILSQSQVTKLVVVMNVVSNTRADLIARGVIKGILELGHEPREVIAAFRVPGSWEDEGRAILEHYGVPYYGRETSIDQVMEAVK